MKMILMGLLLLSAAPIFAQDSLAYEELPECFFEVDSMFVLHGKPNNIFAGRVVGIDTCETLEIIEMPFWPLPVNAQNNIAKLSEYRSNLLAADKIYSNHILSLQTTTELKSIFKEQNDFKDIDSVGISAIRDDLLETKVLFEQLKDSLGDFKIYINNYQQNVNNKYDAIRFDLVFDNKVSIRYVLNMLEQVDILTFEHYFYASPTSVKSPENFNITTDSYKIYISNAQEPLHIQIYDLSGNIIKSFGKITDKEYTIDMDEFNQGVYFVKINNQIVKYIGVR